MNVQGTFRRLLRQFATYLSGGAANGLAAIFGVAVFTRILAVEEYGWIVAANAAAAVFTVLIGLNLSHAIPRYYFEDSPQPARFMGSLLLFSGGLTVVALMTLLTAGPVLGAWLGLPVHLLPAIAVLAGGQVWLHVFDRYYVARGDSMKATILGTLGIYGSLAVGVVAVLEAPNEPYLYKAYAEAAWKVLLAAIAVGVVLGAKALVPRWTDLRYAMRYSVPRLPFGLSALVLLQVDRIMINGISGAAAAAQYSVALSVAMMNAVVLTAISSTLLSEQFAAMKNKGAVELDRTNEQFIAVLCAAGVSIGLFGDWIVVAIADEQYRHAGELIPMLSVALICQGAASVYSRSFDFAKMTLALSAVTSIVALIKIVANVPLIGAYGSDGAALAMALAFGILVLALWYRARATAGLYVMPIGRLSKVVAPAVTALLFGGALIDTGTVSIHEFVVRGGVVALYGAVGIVPFLRREIRKAGIS